MSRAAGLGEGAESSGCSLGVGGGEWGGVAWWCWHGDGASCGRRDPCPLRRDYVATLMGPSSLLSFFVHVTARRRRRRPRRAPRPCCPPPACPASFPAAVMKGSRLRKRWRWHGRRWVRLETHGAGWRHGAAARPAAVAEEGAGAGGDDGLDDEEDAPEDDRDHHAHEPAACTRSRA